VRRMTRGANRAFSLSVKMSCRVVSIASQVALSRLTRSVVRTMDSPLSR
jgi:hypothetical protein